MKVAVGLRRVAAGKRTSGRRAAQIAGTANLKKYTSSTRLITQAANSHFLRTAGPHFPDSQGHIKRTALEIGRAERVPPC